MNNGRLAVLGLAAALGIGTTAAVLEYRSNASRGSIVELAGDDLQTKPREDGEANVIVEEDDAGEGDDTGNNVTTRGGRGTGGKTTGGQAGDTTQNDTTRGGRGTGGKTTGGQAGDTTQTGGGNGGFVFVGGGGGTDDGGSGGGGSASGGGTS
jgi:hypothetical protein